MQEGNRSQKPPPSMPPSGIVGVIASSTRSLRSLTSISVAPPTRKMRYPFDLVAHQGAALADGFLGRFYWVRDRYGFEKSSCRAGCHCPAGAASLTLPATAWRIFA